MANKQAILDALTDTYENGTRTFASEVVAEMLQEINQITNGAFLCGDTSAGYYTPCETCIVCIAREVIK